MGSEGGRRLSVVVPVYGSALILPETHRRLTAALAGLEGLDYEIVYVNDGSPDNAGEILRGIVANDRRARLLSLSRNFGHQAAITAGLDHAVGDAVVVIDDDLQDPPEVIPQMVEFWLRGNKVVYGVRATRKGDRVFKRASARVFYRLLSWLSDRPLPLDAADFRLLDRSVVDVVRQMREESRYMRGMVSWVGFQQCPLSYERDARYAGKSNYNLSRSVRLALDGITSFSTKPLQISAAVGALVTLLAGLAAIWLVIDRIVDPGSVLPRTTTVVVTVLFMGGVQLMTIGILGTYLGKVFTETRKRPLYISAEKLGFAGDEPPPCGIVRTCQAAGADRHRRRADARGLRRVASSHAGLVGAKAVVFGGCGFLGSHIARALVQAGADTLVYDSSPSHDAVPPAAAYHQGDVLDSAAVVRALEGAGRVFAFTGGGGAPASLEDPQMDFSASYSAQLVLLEAVRVVCPEATVVFPGSRLEYGRPQRLPVDETHSLAGDSPYAVNKITCAAYYRVYAQVHGLHTIVLRISNPYGPHRLEHCYKGFGIVNHFIDQAVLGRPLRLFGDGSQLRDFVFIDDVVEAVLSASGRPDLAGTVINVGAGEGVPLAQVAAKIVELVGRGSIEHVPWPEDFSRLETGDFYFDISRAHDLLGWRPRTSLDCGLEKTVAAQTGA